MTARSLRRVVTLALCVAAPAALAQESAEDQARTSFERGVRALQAGRYPAAIAELEFSYSLVPRCSTQFNLGAAFEQTHRYAEAVDTFERYRADCRANMPAQNETYIAEALPRMRAHVGSLSLRVTPASAGATVLIDRRPRAAWDGDIALDPGAHQIEVRARDGSVVRRDVQLIEGARAVVEVSLGGSAPQPRALEPDPYSDVAPAGPIAAGRLRIDSVVSHATVTVDGRDFGEAPVDRALSAGRHQVEVRAEGFHPSRWSMLVADGAVTRLVPALERETSHEASAERPFYTRWWFWTIVGAAVAGGVTAGVVVATSRTHALPTTSTGVNLQAVNSGAP